ncbi:N-acyl-D-amino-acid deacylase [Curtobacterium luteum]|uniref:N-acyl-D-amino-acid deacylase n=1 Tax=Curtobacterium luteum TaxID=33881 RepID=A0A8H9G929_9MICO|nr:amidohydrolase family protein [Curtobacterium luteum]MBM7802309.1 N-acyl-D-amino-acid deacylase [Curtobacterium luteum]NUU52413.1 amidohydrolase family protein [Curtobacterium luteum]GGK91830.1 N-acyl-D-aspartate/D-glutamate deacylase [Curtobacterium luteum]
MTAVPEPVLLAGGSVVGADARFHPQDVLVVDGRVAEIGRRLRTPVDAVVVDCTDRVVMPGFVDAHSHAGSLVFDERVQLALLRQGVTSIVTGQDGVGPAPGDGSWAARYFAAIDGPHPTYRGGGIAGLLATYDGATPLNVATLVPAGTVRHEVMGDDDGPADAAQLDAMRALVRQGIADGAVGLATGLDYVPGLHASTEEIAALATESAAVRGRYVTHMRGGYETNVGAGIDEIVRICRAGGGSAHVSHLHAPVGLALAELERAAARWAPLSFDAYPYSRGCTILSMLLLPAGLARPGTDDLARALDVEGGRERLRGVVLERVLGRADLGAGWAEQITLSHVPAAEFHALQGRTLAEAADATGTDPVDLALDVLVDSDLQVTVVMRVPHPRTPLELAELYRYGGHTGGSDGIFVGTHPHPRAYGTFARYLGDYARTGLLTWREAQEHLSALPASLFQLDHRGAVAPGWTADLIVVDPERVAARSTYADPMRLAEGIDDVLVAGVPVLRDGARTGATPGAGLRRTPFRHRARSAG